jgi:hypothetical protein
MLTWNEKKVLIFMYSIIGAFSDENYWKSFHISERIQAQIDKVVKDVEDLACMFPQKDKDYDQICSDIKKGIYKIECLHNQELEEKIRKVRKMPVTVRKEDLDDLLELLCVQCKDCTRNTKACKQRKLLKRMNIDAYDPDRTESKCEYWYKGG